MVFVYTEVSLKILLQLLPCVYFFCAESILIQLWFVLILVVCWFFIH